MTDPRVTPDPADVTLNEPAQITGPIVDLTHVPSGARTRQLLYGDQVTVLNRREGHCLIRAGKDGYCGYVPLLATGPVSPVTHKVIARATHAYTAPDLKSPDRVSLSFGAAVTALSETATFVETALGFIPRQHVHRADTFATDPAAIAEVFLGTPYLWGGNSHLGIDCSGLMQAACLACNILCPGDSDQQSDAVGTRLAKDAVLQRNDLVFWTGHVALVTDPDTLIHANAGHMAVAFEPIADALARIERQGDGQPTGYRRLHPAG